MIPETLKKELQQRVSHAVTKREAAVDVMKELQRHYGWLTDEAIVEAAGLLGLSPLQVEELATFYEKIYRRPLGATLIQVCDSISCWTACCEKLMAHLSKRLGVEPGGTTSDGSFTLVPCCCLGRCGEAPGMFVGDTFHGNLTEAKVDEILEQARKGAP